MILERDAKLSHVGAYNFTMQFNLENRKKV